jgi:rare lipoprotein A (peptidoglycan hydrolase)
MPRFGNGRSDTAFGRLGITLIALLVQPLLATAALAVDVTEIDMNNYLVQPASLAPIVAPKPAVYERGIASTYGVGDGFEGNLTACGQVFRTQVVQVAHKTLPCGTMIRIEGVDTGKSVDAEVTDRGPYIRGRIVDLSWAAFKQLDPSGPGLLSVNVYLLT